MTPSRLSSLRFLLALLALVVSLVAVQFDSYRPVGNAVLYAQKTVHVTGYTKKDGTVVAPSLALASLQGRNGTAKQVIPTTINAVPDVFARGQVIGLNLTFQMKTLPCGGFFTPGFMVRLYDDKVVGKMSDADLKYQEKGASSSSTKFFAWALVDFDPRPNVGDTVARTTEQFLIPLNAPSRVYVVLWSTCSHLEHLPTDPRITVVATDGAFIGGQYYKFNCPGGKEARCVYQKE